MFLLIQFGDEVITKSCFGRNGVLCIPNWAHIV